MRMSQLSRYHFDVFAPVPDRLVDAVEGGTEARMFQPRGHENVAEPGRPQSQVVSTAEERFAPPVIPQATTARRDLLNEPVHRSRRSLITHAALRERLGALRSPASPHAYEIRIGDAPEVEVTGRGMLWT